MWQVVVENLIPLIFLIITPAVVLLVHGIMKKLAAKWHLEGALAYDDKVDELVLKGIKAAEQKSLAMVAKGGEQTPGEQKMDLAMKFVNAQLVAMKLPEKAASELSLLVESHIFDGAKVPSTTPTSIPPKQDPVPVQVTVAKES